MKSVLDMNEEEIRSRFDFSRSSRGRFSERYAKGYSVEFLAQDPDSVVSSYPPDRSDSTREAGSRILESRVRRAGYRLADPLPGDKVDYLVYEVGDGQLAGRHCGIKITTSAHEAFMLSREWRSIPHAILAYVWRAHDPSHSDIYALTYSEAYEIIRSKEYVHSPSWTEGGKYSVTHAGKELTRMLDKYRLTDERLRIMIQGI